MSDLSCGTYRTFAVLRGLSSCSKQAQLPWGMWDLSSLTRGGTCILCIARWIYNHWTTREVPDLIFLKRENTQIGCCNCGQNEKEEAHGAWEGITGKEPAQMNLRRLPGREAPVQTGLGNRRKFNDKNRVQQIQAKKSESESHSVVSNSLLLH